MNEIDLHVHTSASRCGLHSLLEVLAHARGLGMRCVAITDHDDEPAAAVRVLSYRFPREWEGLRVLAGIELGIRDGGRIRIPHPVKLRDLDICLAGFHANSRERNDLEAEELTDELEYALAHYPFIDVISHPTIRGFALEPERTARLAARHGAALEVNNCSLRYGKEEPERVLALLDAARRHGCLVAIDSDAHTVAELGGDEKARPLVEQAGIPAERIVNRSLEAVVEFVEARRRFKRAAPVRGEGA
ncbi:MAG: PHP domain-containing protein [Deltaproteobacteria bacterium]|nr:PHP domain-containing protein [Deltaproteobacteria bacterium]